MAKLKTNPDLRGFRFTVHYESATKSGSLAVEMTTTDKSYPTKREVAQLARLSFIDQFAGVNAEGLELCITNIHEFKTIEDYFFWIGFK